MENVALLALDAFFSLDFAWIVQLILEYPVWLMFFGTVAAILMDKRPWFWATVSLAFLVWSFGAFLGMMHWAFPPELLMLDLLLGTVIFVFEPSSKWISSNFGPVSVFRFLLPMTILNVFFLVGF